MEDTDDHLSRPSTSASGPSHPSPPPAATTAAPGAGSRGPPGPAQQLSRRRRGHGIVTPTACTECRKKRAKVGNPNTSQAQCDGLNPCGRCKSQGDVRCVYEVPIRQSKDTLRTELEQLRQRKQVNDRVLAALVRPELWQDVLDRLQRGQSVEVISNWLGDLASSENRAQPSHPQPTDPGISALGFTQSGPRGSVSSLGLSVSSQSTVSPTLGHYQAQLQPPPQHGHIPPLRTSEMEHGPHRTEQGQHRMEQGQPSPWNLPSHSQGGVSTAGDSRAAGMGWVTDASQPSSRVGSWVRDSAQPEFGTRYRWLDQVLSPLEVPPEVPPYNKSPAATWTNLTSDLDLVEHLLSLYFCWEYPTFASLSKEHFLKDFREGRRRYCSPMLVSALLALGCRFSTKPNTRSNPMDPHTSGDHFFKESLGLYHQEQDHCSLTTIQALGIMAIREASCGRDSESWYYAGQSIRIAVEMGLHLNDGTGDEDEVAVQAATFWGAFALDHAWSLATGSLPQCSFVVHLPPKPAIIGVIESSIWIPYTDDGATLQRSCVQPSNVRSVYKCFCELSELVHQSLYIFHSPGRPLTSRDLLGIYTQYLNWYDQIPDVLRLGQNFTPAVLFAHMYYHFAILLLFRPLIKLKIINSTVLPRDVCCQAADAIQSLLRSYAQLYTLRRTPSFVPYFVLTSAIMHMAIAASTPRSELDTASHPREHSSRGGSSSTEGTERDLGIPRQAPSSTSDPRVLEAIRQGITDLAEMAPCHHFAQQALNILRYLAKRWNLDVDVDREEKENEEGSGMEKDMEKEKEKQKEEETGIDKEQEQEQEQEQEMEVDVDVEKEKEKQQDQEMELDTEKEMVKENERERGREKKEKEKGKGKENDDSSAARLVKPYTSSLNFFAPNVQLEDVICAWGTPAGTVIPPGVQDTGAGAGTGAGAAMPSDNPLFWPFPLQGRPMLPTGQDLFDAGFEFI